MYKAVNVYYYMLMTIIIHSSTINTSLLAVICLTMAIKVHITPYPPKLLCLHLNSQRCMEH